MKTLVDSSGWIEFFSDGPLAGQYASYLLPSAQLVTPTLVVYEVYKKIKRECGEETALLAVARLNATEVVPLTTPLALIAADLSLKHSLAMADAVIYATACDREARLITSDADLKNLPGVVYLF